MFYLSKRLGSLVNRLSTSRVPKIGAISRSKLNFEIDYSEFPEKVEDLGGLVPKCVCKKGNEYVYLIASGTYRPTGYEERYAEEAKAVVIDSLSKSGEEIDIGLFGRAREIATIELLKHVGKERADLFSYLIAHDTVGYGPISILLEDKQHIEEIEINSPAAPISIFHVKYGRCKTNLSFKGENQFRHTINKYIYDTDKELSEDSPIIDAQVENARVHAQIKPYALSGAVASIRLTDNKRVGIDYLIKKESTNFDVLAYLWMAMGSDKNMLISGSPASGKSTLMSALFSFITIVDKIVTIEEEVNELKIKLDINNTVALYGSGNRENRSTRQQVINALRMRPDRIVVGEIRGEETRELFSAANLGIPFMTTMHSNQGGAEIIKRLMAKPMSVEVKSLSMLDLAIYMKHVDISKRQLSDIYEYRWLSRAETENGEIEIEDSDSFEIVNIVSNGALAQEKLPESKVIDHFAKKEGISKKEALKEFTKRGEFLKVTCESSRNPNEVFERIQNYFG